MRPAIHATVLAAAMCVGPTRFLERANANGQVAFTHGRYESLLDGSRRETRSRTRETR